MTVLGMLALTSAVLALALRQKNAEIAFLLTIACSAMVLIGVLDNVASVAEAVQQIVAASQINTGYIAVLLRVIGICLLTEFTANACRDAGSTALAENITLAGKLMATVAALPLYVDILNTVKGLLQG